MNPIQSLARSRNWIALLLFGALAGCGSTDPLLGTGGLAVLGPAVTAVTPVDTATAVSVTAPGITATFNQAMAPIGAGSSFTVKCAAPCADAAGTVTFDGTNTVATFNLAPGTTLAPMTLYTATITGARSLATGFPMANPFVWTFTTGAPPDITRPRVTVTQPATTSPGPTTGVPTNTAITATFTEDMLPASISGTSFTLTCAGLCVSPTGTVSYSVATRTAVFTPAAPLDASVTYTATVTTGATDLAGNALAGNQAPLPAASNYVWTFNTDGGSDNVAPTITLTNPADLSTTNCINKTVNITFSEAMDPLTITGANIQLKVTAGGAAVAGAVSYDSATHIATLDPNANLPPNTNFTVTIKSGPTGVKDLAGNQLAGNQGNGDNITTFNTDASTCAAPAALGDAAPFGSLGGSAGITNEGLLTVVNGDIGTTAVSTAVTGFHDSTPGCTYTETPLNKGAVNGLIFTAAPPPSVACPNEGTAQTFTAASKARDAGVAAYNDLAGRPGGLDPTGGSGNLGGLTNLAPGVYKAAGGSFMIVGTDLTLDAGGDANAVWIFQMATTLTVGAAAAPRSVVLINGAQAKNVFWQVGSAATINAAGGGTMVGTIISAAGANFSTSGNVAIVTLNGRVLSTGASVTLVNTVINVPAP